jgi:hypothetical protein
MPCPPRLDHENAAVGHFSFQHFDQSRRLLGWQTAGQANQNQSRWAKPLSEGKIAEIFVLADKGTPLGHCQGDHTFIGGARADVGGSHYVVSGRLQRISYDR